MAILAPLPSGWKEYLNRRAYSVYCKGDKFATWEHPADRYFRQEITVVRKTRIAVRYFRAKEKQAVFREWYAVVKGSQMRDTLDKVKAFRAFRAVLAERYRRNAIIAQSFVRMTLAIFKLRKTCCTIMIQSFWRMAAQVLVRRHAIASARRIQRIYRVFVFRNIWQRKIKPMIIRAQAHIRMWLTKLRYLKMKASAVTIQTQWRGYVARVHLALAIASAITIQTVWRGVLARIRFRKARIAIVGIEAFYRGIKARVKTRRMERAREWLRKEGRRAVRKVTFSTPNIQRVWRGHRGRKWAYRVRLRHVRIAWEVAEVPVRQEGRSGIGARGTRGESGAVAAAVEQKTTSTKPKLDHLLPENIASTYTAAKATMGADGQPLAAWQGTFVPMWVLRVC